MRAMRRLTSSAAIIALLAAAMPARAQQLPDGQSEADYRAWLAANPQVQGQIMSFEAWQERTRAGNTAIERSRACRRRGMRRSGEGPAGTTTEARSDKVLSRRRADWNDLR